MSSTTTSGTELELNNIENGNEKGYEANYPGGPSEGAHSEHTGSRVDISNSPPAAAIDSEPTPPSTLRSAGLLTMLASISLLNTFNSGMLVVALPTIADELHIKENLLLWPSSVYSLGLSCFLLLLGAIADVVGNRPILLTGLLLYTAFTLGVSLAQTGDQLIAFRTVQGVAMAFCMPPAVSTITSTFPSGRTRNIGFAVFGGGNPVGFALGLVLGGVFVQVSNWRVGYWMSTSINAASMVLAFFVLPKRKEDQRLSKTEMWTRCKKELDWVGVTAASACLALFSYIFAEFTYGAGSVLQDKPYLIALLVIAALLIPFFIFWEHRQEKLSRPAILPNSIWRKTEFTAVCVATFLTWSWFNAFGYWATLYFQVTQSLDALQAALRFLPLVVAGLGTNLVAAYIMDRVNAGLLALLGGVVSAVAPLLFALQSPSWSYWVSSFLAMILSVISTDLLFNISNLVITTNFPNKSQALAGGVFNTIAQLGNSIGLAITAIIATAVTDSAGRGKMVDDGGLTYDASLLKGYRASFWTCFGTAIAATAISSIGLRKAGKVGKKKDE